MGAEVTAGCLRAVAASLIAVTIAATPGFGAAKFSLDMLPAVVAADGVTTTAVLVSVRDGYPNNLYAIKGTFSDGMRPYFGLTYNPGATRWETQEKAWDGAQMQFSTDAHGEWRGYIFVRLESGATLGDLLFRVSGIPLRPVGDAGPTVGPWYPMTALASPSTARVRGHVYLDPECTKPAERVVVRALDADGRALGAYLSQNSAVVDGLDHTDKGFFTFAAPPGTKVVALQGRTRYAAGGLPADSPVPLYTRAPGPWPLYAAQTTSVDTVWGDANGDNTLTWADVALCTRLCAGLEDSNSAARADVNTDGAVTLADAVEMAQGIRDMNATAQGLRPGKAAGQ